MIGKHNLLTEVPFFLTANIGISGNMCRTSSRNAFLNFLSRSVLTWRPSLMGAAQ